MGIAEGEVVGWFGKARFPFAHRSKFFAVIFDDSQTKWFHRRLGHEQCLNWTRQLPYELQKGPPESGA